MKVLSIKQPWAWLIVQGFKPVENRNWPTKFRGEFQVHAGKAFDDVGYDWVRNMFPDLVMPTKDEFERGGIVGMAEIYDCVDQMDSEWFFGEYGFLLRNARPMPFIPLRGQLGFFNYGDQQ